MNPYETEALLREYLLFHHGEPHEVLPWAGGPREALGFPARVVEEGLRLLGGRLAVPPGTGRALDLGCAVGRSSFELARRFGEVLGVDYSAAFVEAAATIARDGALPYRHVRVGRILEHAVARLPAGVDPSRVRFAQGDAHAPDPAWGTFDLVLAANLLCRLAEPRRCLAALSGLVRSGGALLVSTPHTWAESWTPATEWLGGTPEAGHPREALAAALAPCFELVGEADVPLLIREHHRKYQWTVADLTAWVRRG